MIQKENLDKLLHFILSNENQHKLFNKENPITDEICVTFIDADNVELSIFFKLNSLKKDVAFRINHYYECVTLGENTEFVNTDIINVILDGDINFGSIYEYDKIKSFIENYLKHTRYIVPEVVTCNNTTPNITKTVTKYWKHVCVAGVITMFGAASYYWIY